MKSHHFALLFIIVAIGFLVTAQAQLVVKMQNESIKKKEYDCLVSAVNASLDAAFTGAESIVTAEGLKQVEEVFFQSLAILHEGITDKVAWETWKQKIPCLVLFDERGYYVYRYTAEAGYAWSELFPYEDGGIPEHFFTDTEELLLQYHGVHYVSEKRYRMEHAEEGVWEQSIVPPCVFAIYAPEILQSAGGKESTFLYAASRRGKTAYFVTEDNYCHLPICEKYKSGKAVARYSTQRESAEEGAIPCEYCLK